jgi:hypothetical protein
VVDSLTDGGSGHGESLATAILAGYAESEAPIRSATP